MSRIAQAELMRLEVKGDEPEPRIGLGILEGEKLRKGRAVELTISLQVNRPMVSAPVVVVLPRGECRCCCVAAVQWSRSEIDDPCRRTDEDGVVIVWYRKGLGSCFEGQIVVEI